MFDNMLIDKINKDYENSKVYFKDLKIDIDEKINSLKEDEKTIMKFIYSNLPISDYSTDFDIYLSFVKHSIRVREEMPWGKSIPEDLFLSHIVFPRINSEKIEDHREILYDIFSPYIKDINNMYDAVVETNYACLKYGTYRSPSRRTASPLTFLNRTFGRCGEQSTFVASVLRSLGIPARQIYTPLWAHCDSNHAWVEAWCDGKWHYLGACEPEPFLDKGWFDAASARSMILHSRIFDRTREYSDKLTDEGPAITINRTEDYGKTTNLKVKIVDEGLGVKGVLVSFQILNYSQFSPLSDILTDENGEANIIIGLGSVLVHVSKDGKYMEKLIYTEETNYVEIKINDLVEKEEDSIIDFDLYPPIDAGNIIKSLDVEEIESHKKRLRRNNKFREEREEYSLSSIEDYTNKIDIDKNRLEEILTSAKFNGEEILKFLNEAQDINSFLLLNTLDEKDYVDLDSDIMKDHINNTNMVDKGEIFERYILCPRISFEEIVPYKSYILECFTDKEKEGFKENPNKIWDYIKDNIKYVENKNYPEILTDPKNILKFKEGNLESKKVLFVAICRSLGIPARLNPIYNIPEYILEEDFISPIREYNKKGKIKLIVGEENWTYGTNWSISRLSNGKFIPFRISGKPEDIINIKLPIGNYRIITSNRLPNGNTFNKKYLFEIKENETKKLEIKLREIDFTELFLDIKLNDFKLIYDDKFINASSILNKDKNLIIWIGEGGEPTEHILNEMANEKDILNELDLNIIFIIENENVLKYENMQRVKSLIPKIKIAIDKDFYMREPIARNLYVNPEELPLVVITEDKLNGLYAYSGYRVGIAHLITKIVNN